MKTLLSILAVVAVSTAHAQFGWDDEPEAAEADPFGVFDSDPFEPAIDPPESAYSAPFDPPPVTPPAVVPVVPWSRSPSVRAEEALVEHCDLEPDVARAYLDSGLADTARYGSPDTRHSRSAACPTYLGRLSANPYAPDSTANPYGPAGSPYSSTSVNNRFGPYGSPYSPVSARNPYASDAPKIVAQDGTYLGELSDDPYDPDSVANPYGRYGSPYSSTSINNPYSTYGSPYSSQSPNNPYATQAPLLFGD